MGAPKSLVMRETLKELKKYLRDPAGSVANDADGTMTEWMGPLTLLRGLKSVVRKKCPPLLETLQFAGDTTYDCADEKFTLYREGELNCWGDSTEECPESRAMSDFSGVRFGIFDMSNNDRKIVGWPRYDKCTDWGCQSGGWEVKGKSAKPA